MIQTINYDTALAYRVYVKFQDNSIKDLYTLYANNLIQAKHIASTKYKDSENAYNFTIHAVKLQTFNPRLK
jgi:hypothetical protein